MTFFHPDVLLLDNENYTVVIIETIHFEVVVVRRVWIIAEHMITTVDPLAWILEDFLGLVRPIIKV
jgi:hypothetical protein